MFRMSLRRPAAGRMLAGLTLLIASIASAQPSLTVQDRSEIEELYARYNIAIDRGDAEKWASLFTPDGRLNDFVGREALVKFAEGFHQRGKGLRRHWNTNLAVDGDQRAARGTVYLLILDVSTKPAGIALTSTYDDELVKTEAGWRFSRRTTRPD